MARYGRTVGVASYHTTRKPIARPLPTLFGIGRLTSPAERLPSDGSVEEALRSLGLPVLFEIREVAEIDAMSNHPSRPTGSSQKGCATRINVEW